MKLLQPRYTRTDTLYPDTTRVRSAMARLQQAETILGLVADVRVKLDSTLVGWARGNLDDMQAQLAALVSPGFLRDVPASVLAEYPRYLKALRSEEHTSELQSLMRISYAVFCLKKKKHIIYK